MMSIPLLQIFHAKSNNDLNFKTNTRTEKKNSTFDLELDITIVH
jgi:hypothetical protein